MDKIVFIGMLYDYYAELLTEKQSMAIEYYYFCDLSLSEIGENLNISRQAVSDLIKRSEQKLEEYEDKLHFVKKTRDLNDKLSEIEGDLLELEEGEEIKRDQIKNIRKKIQKITAKDGM